MMRNGALCGTCPVGWLHFASAGRRGGFRDEEYKDDDEDEAKERERLSEGRGKKGKKKSTDLLPGQSRDQAGGGFFEIRVLTTDTFAPPLPSDW